MYIFYRFLVTITTNCMCSTVAPEIVERRIYRLENIIEWEGHECALRYSYN